MWKWKQINIITKGGTIRVNPTEDPIVIEILSDKDNAKYVINDDCSLKKIRKKKVRDMVELLKNSHHVREE